MTKIKKILYRLKPRIYVCRDVVMIRWLDFEFIIPRFIGQ